MGFVGWVVMRCADAGYTVRFEHRIARGYYSGWVDGRVLTVYTTEKDWIPTLAHEMGHVEQELEGLWSDHSAWQRFNRYDDRLGSGERVRVSAKLIRDTRYIQECEIDANFRAEIMLNVWGVDYDRASFVRYQNLDVARYEMALRKIRYEGRISTTPEAFKLVRSDRLLENTDVIDPSIQAAIDYMHGRKTKK